MKDYKVISWRISVSASVMSLLAFFLYNSKIVSGNSQPNLGSWLVWSFVTILNFTSYRSMTGSWSKSLLPTVNSLACILTSCILIAKGYRLVFLGIIDQWCLGLGLIASLCWWVLKRKNYAEMIVQIILEIALTIGAIPTLVSVWHVSTHEPWFPWCLWAISYAIQIYVVSMSWRGKLIDFLYPVNMLFFHGLISVLALL